MKKTRNRVVQPQGRLTTRTRELLNASDLPYISIYKETLIQPAWLTTFANGRIPDPSVNTIEALYNFLSDKPLIVE